ncbi:MAG: glutamate 5-kinase [Pseudomonadales bacterium]|nr:glutamate 5-kinase [Pseudomonadales bacterium]
MTKPDISHRQALREKQCFVLKIGSALLTDNGKGLDEARLANWIDQIAAIKSAGVDIVLVSSGAVAVGLTRLGLTERPNVIHELQAAAAVGQAGLVNTYERNFQRHAIHTAQILLTHDDLSDRKRYLNARATIKQLLAMDVIPIVNENDTVVTDEIRFGDNDTLAALVANLVGSDALIILTDQDGLFTEDPRVNKDATLIQSAWADDTSLDALAGGSHGSLGRGGMITKLRAARIAARSGAVTYIVGGRIEQVLTRIFEGDLIGTELVPRNDPLTSRKLWLAGQLQTRGVLVLDAGAVTVLKKGGKSLLPVGVKSVTGRFVRGDVVICADETGTEIARGIVNYNLDESMKICGFGSDRIAEQLGYCAEPELIHRDNMTLSE